MQDTGTLPMAWTGRSTFTGTSKALRRGKGARGNNYFHAAGSSIFMLDEVTSGLDYLLKKKVIKAFLAITSGRSE
jgi:hypothetical protein